MMEFYIHSLAGIAFLLGNITSLGHSVTCTFLASPFFTAEMFWDRVSPLFNSIHVGFPATQNICDRYNKFAINHLKLYSTQ